MSLEEIHSVSGEVRGDDGARQLRTTAALEHLQVTSKHSIQELRKIHRLDIRMPGPVFRIDNEQTFPCFLSGKHLGETYNSNNKIHKILKKYHNRGHQ